MTNVTQKQIQGVLNTMTSEIGKPYSQAIPARFGTAVFDCSGIIWYAFTKNGIPMPGGPSDDGAAIVDPEIQWLASQPGAQVITDASQVKAGDVIGFVGADAGVTGNAKLVNGKLQVGSKQVQSMGHIGMATSNSQYVSAYDTADGVTVKPISGDQFVVAVRPMPGDYTANTGGGDSGGDSGSGGGTITFPDQITKFFTDAQDFTKAVMWITRPANWVRLVAGFAGLVLLLFAIHALVAAGSGQPLVKAPSVIPVPVPV
jgi:NlpC/P60 family